MPFFLKSCFKIRRNTKKNKKKPPIKILSDVTTPVTFEEIIQQCEPIAVSIASDEVDETNASNHHSFFSSKSQHTIDLKEDIKKDDISNDIVLQNFDKHIEDLCEKSNLKEFERESSDASRHFEDTTSDTIIHETMLNNPNISEELEASQEITDYINTVRNVLEPNDISEKVYIEKKWEIVNTITVNSNIFEKMDELRALDKDFDTLHFKNSLKKSEKVVSNTDAGDFKIEKDGLSKIPLIDSIPLDINMKREKMLPVCPQDTSFTDHKINESLITEIVEIDETGDKQNLNKIPNTDLELSVICSIDGNKKAHAEELCATEKNNETISLEVNEKNPTADSETEIEYLENPPLIQSDGLVLSGGEIKDNVKNSNLKDTFLACNKSDTLYVASETAIYLASRHDIIQRETDSMPSSDILKSVDNIVNNNILLEKSNEYVTQTNKHHTMSYKEDVPVKDIDVFRETDSEYADIEFEFNIEDQSEINLSETSTQNITPSERNLSLVSQTITKGTQFNKSCFFTETKTQQNYEENEISFSNSEFTERKEKHDSTVKSLPNEKSFMNINNSSENVNENKTHESFKNVVCYSNLIEDAKKNSDVYPGGKIYFNHMTPFSKFECQGNLNYSDTKATETLESALYDVQNESSKLDSQTEKSNIKISTVDKGQYIENFDNESTYEICLDDNDTFETHSSTLSDISDARAETFLNTGMELKKVNSVTDGKIKQTSPMKDNEKQNDSTKSLALNVQYCQDDNNFCEESEDNNNHDNIFSLFQQSRETVSKDLQTDNRKREKKKLSLESLEESSSFENNEKNLKNLKHHQDDICQSFDEIEHFEKNKMSKQKQNVRYKKKSLKTLDATTASKFLRQSTKKKSQTKNLGGHQFQKEMYSDFLPNKHTATCVSPNIPKKICVSKYSLSDCSNSSESIMLTESGFKKEPEIQTEASDSFVDTRIGDNITENIFSNEIGTLHKVKKKMKSYNANTALHHTLAKGKAKHPKIRKERKIEINIINECSHRNKISEAKRNAVTINNKHSYDPDANLKFLSGDNIKFLLYLNKNENNIPINRAKKRKESKTRIENETSFHEYDKIENKRIENINLFNTRKQNIILQMGPNIRNIPIKTSYNLNVQPCKIEKLGINTDVLMETDKLSRESPNSQKFSAKYKGTAFSMKKKPASLTNKRPVHSDSTQTHASCEFDSVEINKSLEKMSPMRKKILDSSRLIRSPKYPSPLKSNAKRKKEFYHLKSIFLKCAERKLNAQLKDDGNNINALKNEYERFSPENKSFKLTSLTKRHERNEESARHQVHHHTQNFRATSPDDLKSKFDSIFKKYAGRGRCNGELISYKRSTEWLQDAGLISKLLTAEEATDAFKCYAGVKVTLNKSDYRQFLKKLTRVKRLNYNEVYEKLCEASSRCIEG